MSFKEVTELRKSGKLDEAYLMAKKELEEAMAPFMVIDTETGNEINHEADLLWPKRALSWVLFDYIKQANSVDHFDDFLQKIEELYNLQLPPSENLLFDQLAWQFGKMAFSISRITPIPADKSIILFKKLAGFHFTKPSEAYSFLFKSFHKLLKESVLYIPFADWWNFENFREEDFVKEKLENGMEVMAIVEQAYIAYAKHLLPFHNNSHETIFDKSKVEVFLPKISELIDIHPQFQYPPYFKAKLLLALGDKENMLSALLPFAKKKQNDFWVWDIFAEVFINESEKVFACYCRALLCNSPEEMLVNLRQKMARALVSKQLFNEAKTEIEKILTTKNAKGHKIPNEVANWQNLEWYLKATSKKSNVEIYKQYAHIAEDLLFSDIPEETLIVEFVNTDKKMLNFIASKTKFGFFKFERFLKEVKVGDILKVRFNGGGNEGAYKAATISKTKDEAFSIRFTKHLEGVIKISEGKAFGFLDDVYVHPSIVSKYHLTNGQHIKAQAIKSYNKDKNLFTWRVFQIL
jgi:hypothetical protein